MKRGLVLSGGGAKGAFSVGVLDYLVSTNKYQWDIVIGTSTGSLIAPLASINKIDKLKELYLNVETKDIFSINPFKTDGKFKILNAIWRIINNKTAFGDASKLKKKIDEMLTETNFHTIVDNRKTVVLTVANYTEGCIEFKNINDCSHVDFKDWMLASASVPMLFEIINKNGKQYLDGGVLETVPIQEAINMGCNEIDIIVLKTEFSGKVNWKFKNILDLFLRTVDIMNNEIAKDDINIAKLESVDHNVKLNFYYTPYSLTNNAIVFNKDEMKKWYNLGLETARTKDTLKTVTIKK